MTLPQAIPDVDVLLSLEPEELGAKLLFLAKARQRYEGDMFHPNEFMAEIRDGEMRQQPTYPRNRQTVVALALTEAWAWLEAQGLTMPAADENGRNGFRVLSRRARRFESEAEFANYAVARLLSREALHSRIADKVWLAFMRGEFDVAVFQAMKAVEVAIREATGSPDSLLGTKLVQDAFAPGKGILADTTAENGEQVGCLNLFLGAIACYKNPQSHRDVNLDDPAEAVEIIFLANHLLRIVDVRRKNKRLAP